MLNLVPFLNVEELKARARFLAKQTTYGGGMKHRINAFTNDLIQKELLKFDELPQLYYQGEVYENADTNYKLMVQAPIIGLKPKSSLYVLGENPFDNSMNRLFETISFPDDVKWIPDLQAIYDAEEDIESPYLIAGAEFEAPDIIGFLPEDVKTNTIGKQTLTRFEE